MNSTILENKQLPLINAGVPDAVNLPALQLVNSLPAVCGGSSPAAVTGSQRLPEGWNSTERYGDVFIVAGKAWVVKLKGNNLKSVMVDVSASDFIGKSAIELRKDAVRKQLTRAKSKVHRTQTANFGVSGIGNANSGVSVQ